MFNWFRSRQSRPQWDVFISYASEERALVAEPLAARLQEGGFQVWLDQLQLHLGSRLSKRIMHGLAQSRFGIVIFSDAYLRKKWTQRELAGLLQFAEDGRHTLLPILHNISLGVIEEQYPALADAVFGSTQGGIDELATEIARVLDMPEYGSPSTISPGVRRRFAALLERQPATDDIVSFLRLSPQILSARLGIIAPDISAEKEAERDSLPRSFLEWSPRFACSDPEHPVDFRPDVYAGDVMLSLSSVDWKIVLFRSPSEQIIEGGTLSAHLEEAIAQIRAFDAASMLHQDLLQHAQQKALPHESVEPDPDDERHSETEEALSLEYMKLLLLGSSVEYFVVAGRRKQLSVNDRQVLKAINEKDEPIRVRTYDWLLAASPLHL